MPARHHVLAILVFWGATTSWLFYHDLWPLFLPGQLPPFTTGLAGTLEVVVAGWLLPGEPPPFAIDLLDEAQAQGQFRASTRIFWTLTKNDEDMGYAQTWVQYNERDDTFDLVSKYKYWIKGRSPISPGKGQSPEEPNLVMENHYRVTREGELRGISAKGKFGEELPLVKERLEIEGNVHGLVVQGRFYSHIEIKSPWGTFQQQLEPVEVVTRGSVLNPMHPLNRITGLHKGQHWRMPLVDPLADAMRATAARLKLPVGDLDKMNDVRYLEAEVLPQTQPLVWSNQEIPCLVIEYHGADLTARTLVRESDGLVFRQEVTQNGETLLLAREDPSKPVPDKR